MTQTEANEILNIMADQEEMFLGGMNDPLMSTAVNDDSELRKEFNKITTAWSEFKQIVENSITD
jgi:hypothetical protein